MKKNAVILGVIVVAIGVFVICLNNKKSRIVSNMALDQTLTVVTGIWDEDNIENYSYLVVPDANLYVNTIDFGMAFPYSKVNTIGENAFYGNEYITKIYIPQNITKVQKNAFYGCESVEDILFGGTEDEWNKIVIESGNDVLLNTPIQYNSEMPQVSDQ
jgi:hypothetical protein